MSHKKTFLIYEQIKSKWVIFLHFLKCFETEAENVKPLSEWAEGETDISSHPKDVSNFK